MNAKAVKLALAVVVVGLVLQGVFCSADSSVARVAVLQSGNHPILDSVSGGCVAALKKELGDDEVELFNAGGDSQVLASMARQVMYSGFEVVVTVATPPTLQVLGVGDGKGTSVVFTFVTDPESAGYPGPGNSMKVTGLKNVPGYDGTIQAVQAILPNAKTLGYLVSSEPSAQFIMEEFQRRAADKGLSMVVSPVQDVGDISTAVRVAVSQCDALIVGGDHVLVGAIASVLDIADLHGKPVFCLDEGSVRSGAIAASTIDYDALGRSTAGLVMTVLRGTDAGAISVSESDDFYTVVNPKAAARLGLTIPEGFLATSRSAVEEE